MLMAIETRVVVIKIESSTTTAGGIFLQTAKDHPRAQVVSVGHKVESVKVGDTVIIGNWGNAPMLDSKGTDYFITDIQNILAIEV